MEKLNYYEKSIGQKIAEVKIPEFTNEVRNSFLKFQEAQNKAEELAMGG